MTAHADDPPAVIVLLGEATAAAALFTGHAKVDGRLSVQLRSTGALRTLFAECTAAGTVRGIAQCDETLPPPSRDIGALGAGAVLAITIENPARGSQDPASYQGLVALDAATLAEAFEGYFHQSEQLPTRLLLACDGHRATGLMLQKLPGDAGDDDGWNRIGALFDTLREQELLDLPATEVVHRLFHEEAPAWLGDKPLRFACSCSRERVSAMLVSLGREEADAAVVAGDGQAQVRCEFCGQQYRYGAAAIAALFHAAGRELPVAAGLQ
jgi:molecular chaperone Hsp33